MKLITRAALALGTALLCQMTAHAETRPGRHHEVFFPGSDYELNVYYVNGRQDGKTLLLIGGIQGDEPGGYLSADLYPDLELEKGNLIVVPRANLKSIILGDRGPDGDMNRQFHDDAQNGPMLQVVNQLKILMSKADLFLHLHDGWGFHSPVYIDSLRNPNRYGQSLIADADDYQCSNGSDLKLGEMANGVLEEVNKQIENKDHYLHFFNTRTADPDTPYTEMRKTATFYALRKECLPAFGVEASKNLPSLTDKIRYHNLVINAFMERLGIVPETPKVLVANSALHFAEFQVDGKTETLKDQDTLYIHKGDTVKVTQVGSDYQRGVTVDILGLGNLNDAMNDVKIDSDTQVVFRKEGQKFGSINVRTLDSSEYAKRQQDNAKQHRPGDQRVFVISVNGQNRVVMENETLQVSANDTLELITSFTNGSNDDGIQLNLRGWLPETPVNHDDRGYLIQVGKSHFLRQYSESGQGNRYPVIASNASGQPMGQAWIEISR
ncbi:M14/M99 family metallopeptidase [Pokkaliibacter sp. CJK22405]|uniref:M14/M99 family metallopeptidase n=1 Tax=Pokkaliibacter sp. CJK22405 TaxID=3384615 RepID=UPI0039850001